TTVIRPQVHHDVCICYRPLGNFRFYGAIPTPGGWGGIIAVDHLNLETAHGPTVVLRRQIDRLFHRCAFWDHGSLHRPARDDFDRALRLGHRDANACDHHEHETHAKRFCDQFHVCSSSGIVSSTWAHPSPGYPTTRSGVAETS